MRNETEETRMAKESEKTTADPAATPAKDAKGRAGDTKMTASEAAKLVRRMVPKSDDRGAIVRDKDGNPVAVPQAIKADEVMSFADYSDRVVVVTTSGEK